MAEVRINTAEHIYYGEHVAIDPQTTYHLILPTTYGETSVKCSYVKPNGTSFNCGHCVESSCNFSVNDPGPADRMVMSIEVDRFYCSKYDFVLFVKGKFDSFSLLVEIYQETLNYDTFMRTYRLC